MKGPGSTQKAPGSKVENRLILYLAPRRCFLMFMGPKTLPSSERKRRKIANHSESDGEYGLSGGRHNSPLETEQRSRHAQRHAPQNALTGFTTGAKRAPMGAKRAPMGTKTAPKAATTTPHHESKAPTTSKHTKSIPNYCVEST